MMNAYACKVAAEPVRTAWGLAAERDKARLQVRERSRARIPADGPCVCRQLPFSLTLLLALPFGAAS